MTWTDPNRDREEKVDLLCQVNQAPLATIRSAIQKEAGGHGSGPIAHHSCTWGPLLQPTWRAAASPNCSPSCLEQAFPFGLRAGSLWLRLSSLRGPAGRFGFWGPVWRSCSAISCVDLVAGGVVAHRLERDVRPAEQAGGACGGHVLVAGELLHHPDFVLRLGHLCAATVGRCRKSVVTAAATSSSRARVWIAVIFSCGVTGLTTWRPTRRLASSGVHRALPSGGVRMAANRSSSSTMPARILVDREGHPRHPAVFSATSTPSTWPSSPSCTSVRCPRPAGTASP